MLRASQNTVSDIKTVMHTVITQPIQDNPETPPEGSLKFLTSGTYREPSGDSQETNTKI